MKRTYYCLKSMCLVILLFFPAMSLGQTHKVLDEVRLQLKWLHQFQFAGYYAAKEKGFYKEEGLDVTIEQRDPNTNNIRQVLDGDAEYGIADSILLLYRMRGEPVVLLAPIFQQSPLVYMTLTRSGIESPYQIKGKRVMVYTEDTDGLPLAAMLNELGIEKNAFTPVPKTVSPDALEKEAVDVYPGYLTNEPYYFQNKDIKINIIDPKNYGVDFYGDMLFTSETELKNHPGRVERFVRASLKGWRYALEHTDEIVDVIIEKYGVKKSREHLHYEAEIIQRMIKPEYIELGKLDQGRLRYIAKTFKRLGFIDHEEVPKDFFYRYSPESSIELTAEERAFLDAHPVIRVSNEIGWPPFDYVDRNKPSGFSIDYLNLVASKVGLRLKYINGYTWNELLEMSRRRELDLMQSIVKTPAREKYLDFTEPYARNPTTIFVRTGTTGISGINDLEGKRVAVVKGFFLEEFLELSYSGIELLPVPSVLKGLEAVSLGQADAILGRQMVINWILHQNFITNVVGVATTGDPRLDRASLRLGVRNDWPELAAILQKGMDAITQEEYNRLLFKWSVMPKAQRVPLTVGEQEWLKNHPSIRVANETDWPPFDFTLNGVPTGYSIDLLDLIAGKIGLHIEYVSGYTWDELIKKGKRRELDLFPAIWKTPEREQFLNFTTPYIDTPYILVVRENENRIHTIDDLNGRILAGVKGYASTELVKEHYPEIQLQEVSTPVEGMRLVSYDKADAYLGSSGSTIFHIKKHLIPNLQITAETTLGGRVQASNLHIAVRNDWPELHGIVQKTLDAVTQEEIDALQAKWLRFDTKQRTVALTEEEQKFLEEHPVIRVSNEMDWPPFDFAVGGEPKGFSIDYLNLLAEKAGLRLEYINGYTWNELLELFKQKELDVLHSLVRTPEREDFILFTNPYYRYYTTFIVHKDAPAVEELRQLYGKTVAVPKGWAYEEFLKGEAPDVNLYIVNTILEAYQAVRDGQADATFSNRAVARYQLGRFKLPELKTSGWFKEYDGGKKKTMHIGVRKDWPVLQSILNKAMDSVTPGEFQKLKIKWFGTHIQPERSPTIAFTKEEQAFLKDHPVLRVAFDVDWPPVEFADKRTGMNGIAADYLKPMSELLGVRFEPASPRSWKEMLTSVRKGELDFFSAISPTPQRREWLDFTDSYLSFPIVIITRKAVPYIGGVSDLVGKSVAVVDGYASHDLLTRNHPELPLMTTRDLKEGLMAVSTGKAFAFVGNLATVSHVIGREGMTDLKVSGETPYTFDITMAAPKGETVLLGLLRKALGAIPPEERNAIYSKWIHVTFEHKVDYSLVWKIIVAALIIVFFILFWNRRLSTMAQELEKARNQAEYANRAKSTFLANMSHELRTPLNAILGFSQIMAHSQNLTPEQKDNLQTINRSGGYLLTLINEILDMSKIEAGQISLNETNFNLYRLLDDVNDIFKPRADAKNLEMRFERHWNVPQYVQTDEGKLRQVLINLLSNAVKFTQEGGISVRLQCHQSAPEDQRGGLMLHFEVEDTGPGITARELDHIFDAFVQTRPGLKSHEGTGLGLSISRKYIQLLGGDIRVVSHVGKGTIFKFEIRARSGESVSVKAEPPVRRVIDLEPGQPRYRILIVDDDETNRQVLVKLLSPLNFELREVQNGREALEIWSQWRPHLIWMDMRMPGLDGYETTVKVKASQESQSTIIIGVSASAFDEEKKKALSAGCDDFISKPFREQEIFEAIHKHLGVRFVYEEGGRRDAKGQQVKEKVELIPEVLDALPAELREAFKKAVEALDFDMAMDVVNRICDQNEPLAEAMKKLVNDYRFDTLQKLFDET